jgi:protein-arginine kinase activator protein McsA
MTSGTVAEKSAAAMLCQACKKRDALIHLSLGSSLRKRKHYCRECADRYFARTPGMNSARDLIKLSNFYRSKLYDELEARHPEAFDNSDTEACRRGSELMRRFLKKRLTKDGIKLNKDGFEMLCHDFFCSHHFYERADKWKRRTSAGDA